MIDMVLPGQAYLVLRFIVILCINKQSKIYIGIQCGHQPASEEVVIALVSGACWCGNGELPASLVAWVGAGGLVSQWGELAALSTSSSLSL